MNSALARNVRELRTGMNWTQQHLADTAGIQLRTVQRVEKGDGASLETLGALSNAFHLPVEVLRFDTEAFLAAAQKAEDEVLKTRDIIPVTAVVRSSQLNIIVGSKASVVDHVGEIEAVSELFADLKSTLADIVDLWSELEPAEHPRLWSSVFAVVQEMDLAGFVVSVGRAPRSVRTGAGTFELETLHVVVCAKGEERPNIAVEKVINLA